MTDNLDKARATQMAAKLWPEFTKDEQTLVRFGMFPAGKMAEADATFKAEEFTSRDMGRLLSVAIMEIADKNGGMIS